MSTVEGTFGKHRTVSQEVVEEGGTKASRNSSKWGVWSKKKNVKKKARGGAEGERKKDVRKILLKVQP